jgi:hypothetical protein
MRNLVMIGVGVCSIIVLSGTADSASAKGGAGRGTGGHAVGSSPNGQGASASHPAGGAGPVGFATGQMAPSGTPLCQPGVCPGRTQ